MRALLKEDETPIDHGCSIYFHTLPPTTFKIWNVFSFNLLLPPTPDVLPSPSLVPTAKSPISWDTQICFRCLAIEQRRWGWRKRRQPVTGRMGKIVIWLPLLPLLSISFRRNQDSTNLTKAKCGAMKRRGSGRRGGGVREKWQQNQFVFSDRL